MKKLFFALALLVPGFLHAAIKTETITYKHGGASLKGYLAYDDATKDKRPGIVVAPEWWGLNDYAKKRAEQLAELGYVVLAADIYGNGQLAADATEAGKLSGFFKGDRNLMRGRIDAAVRALKNQKGVDGKKIAAIGYCFGGTCVLELARAGVDVDGVVSFHGGLDTPTPDDAKNIRAKVLVLHGADDPYVPAEQLAGFEQEMRKGKVDWQLISYGNAVHGFTNSSAGTDNSKGYAYNEKADHRSWGAMQNFLNELFKK